MIIANPPNLNVGTCGGTLTGVAGAGSFSFSGGSLPVGGTCTLTISVTMTVNGNLTNVILANAVTTTQGASNPQPAEASLTNLPGASISKVFAPNPIAAGDFSLLTITIQNTGNIPLTGLGLLDTLPGTLPAGLAVAGGTAPAPVNNCGGTLIATPGSQNIQLSGGSLGASSSCTLVISVTGSTPGNYENCIPIGALINDQGAQNNQPACDTLQVLGGGGITKTLIGSDATHTIDPEVTLGEIVTYEVTVPISPGTYDSARLVDTLDPGLAFVNCISINGTGLAASAGSFAAICQNPTTTPPAPPEEIDRIVTFDFGTLTNNGAQDVPLTLDYRAIVLDIGSNMDGVSRNNSALFTWATGNAGPARTTVTIREPKLVVDKTADNTFIANGTEATITLTISHTATSNLDAFDLLLEDPLPTGLDYVANSLDCTTGAQDPDVECVVDTSNPSQPTIRAQWSVFTRAGGTGLIRFRVTGNALLPVSGNVTNISNLSWTSLPGDHLTPQSFSQPPNQFAIERHFDPGDLVNFYGDDDAFVFNPVGGGPGGGGGGDDEERRRPVTLGTFLIPVTGFAPNTVTNIESAHPAYNSTGLSLGIPALQLNLPIVGVQFQKGTWDVNWLWNQAGWLQKTAYPTFPGNSVITAHVVNADGKPGPFARLKGLRVGDHIYIDLGAYRYTYQVVTNARVKPNDISVLRHEEESWLTLLTCDRYDEKTGKYLVRIAVRAKLIDIDFK
jgi:LPXTG-site transpeptidase (sortase) family protein